MHHLPDGIVTFLFTDVEGSTRLWETYPDAMSEAMEQHDSAIASAVSDHNGVAVKARGEGDSWFIVFASAVDAVAAAAQIQRNLTTIDWSVPDGLTVRTAVHTGSADLRLGDYYGATVNRAARLRGIAHGGQTLVSGSTWEMVQDVLPTDLSVEDMGEHNLKDLTRPERVFQLNVEGLQSSFPALGSLNSVPNNLPLHLTEFVGREEELADVARLLRETRLLTILAPGGSGKTRLAIQAAAEATDEYSDGVFFVALADISAGDLIVQTVSEALGLGLASDEDIQTQLLTYLTGRRLLLVFDNFEHVTDEAPVISAILTAAPDVTVLTTSRAKLGLTGETVYTLAGLDTTWGSPAEALQTSSVQLFIDGATKAAPGFVLEDDDFEAVGRIVNLTGGMPLAILLAAAWADMLPIGEIASEIETSLDILETELGDVPDRHRSIKAVFEYSWELLSEDERSTFAALSVFRGGFTREAGQHVAGASLRSLSNLASKSLVTPNPSTGRYTVHELLRQYAEAELRRDEVRCTEIESAHAEFFTSRMRELRTLIAKSDELGMISAVESDIENIRFAWRHHLSTKNAGSALPFVTVLFYIYELRGWYPAAISLMEEAIAVFDGISNETAVLVCELSRSSLGWFLAITGQVEAAYEAATTALDRIPSSIDLIDRLTVVQAVAVSAAYTGHSEEMAEALADQLSHSLEHPDVFWAAGVKNWQTLAQIRQGNFAKATALTSEAMVVFESRNELYYLTWTLWLQAMIATQEGRHQDAIDLYTRQVSTSAELGYPRGKVVGLQGLADANAAASQFLASEQAFIQAVATAEQMGMVADMAAMMTSLAQVWGSMGRSVEAVEVLSTICGDPIGSVQTFTVDRPISVAAASVLDELRPTMDEQEFNAAVARGSAMTFKAAAKKLLSSR